MVNWWSSPLLLTVPVAYADKSQQVVIGTSLHVLPKSCARSDVDKSREDDCETKNN